MWVFDNIAMPTWLLVDEHPFLTHHVCAHGWGGYLFRLFPEMVHRESQP